MKFPNLEKARSLAVVGANSLIGKEFLQILSESKVRIANVKRLASKVSPQEEAEDLDVELLDENSFEGIEAVFFCESPDVTRRFVPVAEKAGCLIVDGSRLFRLEESVPLVVPQVNGSVLRDFNGSLISIPSCAITPVALALKPLADRFALERVVVSTYQSVSGAGDAAYDELSNETVAFLNGQGVEPNVFPHPVAFNCLPLVGEVSASGDSTEEEGLALELRKTLDLPDLRVSATAVRVPTFCGHGASVNVELQDEYADIGVIRELLDGFPSLKVLDKPESSIYPTNLECIGSDFVFVGRVRRDNSVRSGVNFWIMADNLRKGSALNALESLETLYHYRSLS